MNFSYQHSPNNQRLKSTPQSREKVSRLGYQQLSGFEEQAKVLKKGAGTYHPELRVGFPAHLQQQRVGNVQKGSCEL